MPSASALCQARRRIGSAPLRALFDVLRAAAPGTPGVWWRGRLVCALDGTQMCVPNSPANLAVYRPGGTYRGVTAYPMLRLAALVCCGTRTLLDAVLATDRRSETSLTMDLLTAMRPGMIVLADRYFGYAPMITAVAATGADLLFRSETTPVCPC
ncbi:transposase [Pseudonocardia sp. T1-2H]|uniref:transposase n=1 Tax=Pseudonocardia sp. T1-2H TaxID=3128899 RepID=UPI003101689D